MQINSYGDAEVKFPDWKKPKWIDKENFRNMMVIKVCSIVLYFFLLNN